MSLETVHACPPVQVLGCGVILWTVHVRHKVQCLGKRLTLEIWTCVPVHMVWEGVTMETVDL